MINRAVITGRLTKDPDLRTTGSGLSVAQFTVAVDRQFTDADGKRGADFIQCVAWRKNADNIVKFFSKGMLIGIDGRIQTRTYDNRDSQRVYVTEVVVDSWSFLESKKEQQNQTSSYAPPVQQNQPTSTTSTQTQPSPADPFAGSGDTIDISDDDLPF